MGARVETDSYDVGREEIIAKTGHATKILSVTVTREPAAQDVIAARSPAAKTLTSLLYFAGSATNARNATVNVASTTLNPGRKAKGFTTATIIQESSHYGFVITSSKTTKQSAKTTNPATDNTVAENPDTNTNRARCYG